MTDIEDVRGAAYQSWKSYANALKFENECLRKKLGVVESYPCWDSVLLEIRRGRINGELI